MLNTILDYTIFDHFTKNQPAKIPSGSEEENEYWNSFWKYLKQGTDLVITNFNDEQNIFLNQLTTGRKETKINTEFRFKKPHKCKFPKEQNIRTVFFLNEPLENDRIKYRINNGFLFGFQEDYHDAWKSLYFFGKYKVLPVRKSAKINFKSWAQLSDYILPFTDMIVVDNYMFDESLWDHNLFRIIKEFSKKTNVKFNLLLVSFAKRDQLSSYKDIHQVIKKKLLENQVQCNLSIILAREFFKEHDRGIFTNYLRIKSGDSFVYFDKNGDFITKGTDIDFHSLAEPDKFNAAKAALFHIAEIVEKLKTHPEKDKRLFGDLKNNLPD